MARDRLCDGCKALFVSKNCADCELGFKIASERRKKVILGTLVDSPTLHADPDCPKPRTVKSMMEFIEERNRQRKCGRSEAEANALAKKVTGGRR